MAGTATNRMSVLHKNQCLCFRFTWGQNFSQKIDASDPRMLSHFRLPDPCLDMLYPISIAGSLHMQSICQDPLQNSCAKSMRRDSLLQDPWTLCKIYVSRPSRRSMPPDPCLRFHMRDSSTRCISPNLCLSILICGPSARSMSQDTLQDPWLNVSGSMSPIYASAPWSVDAICKIDVSGVRICDR